MTNKERIIDICTRNGNHAIMSFIRDKGTRDIVEMLERNGDFEDLLEWMAYDYPMYFQEPLDSYVDACEMKMDADREDKAMAAAELSA